MTPSDSQSGPIVRRATPADLPVIGRLGALLDEEHHGFDPQRFLAARKGTPEGYASFISTQLEDTDKAILEFGILTWFSRTFDDAGLNRA